MNDMVLSVRQVAQYPFAAAAAATDAVLLQQGGIGGPYAYTSPAGLVAPSIAASISTATLNLTGVGPIYWNQGQFLQANASGFSFNWPGTPGLLLSIFPTGDATLTGMLSVGRDPANPFEVSTKNYVDATVATAKQLLTDNSVWTVNGKQGNVNLTWADLISMGGAPIMSPAFQGVPTVPSITDDNQHDWQIANTAFVQDVVNCKINALLHAHPFVWSFNGRIGNVCLTTADVNAALTAPGAIPVTTNPPLGDASTRIATTMFVDGSVADLQSWVEQQNFAFATQLTAYAPLASPQFSGIPTAPTAPPATSTGQLATTAYVMAAVQAATSGVVSFNGRTGIVDLTSNDITNATGALLASPVFTGTPQAPTATLGTDTAQLATCAFVIAELGGASIGVMTFNGRGGAVVLTAADITGAGGALLAGPAFSGVPTAPTAATGVATQQLATTAFVASAISALSIGVASFNSRTGAVTLTANDISAAGGAVLASPIFSGQPTAPTASPGTSTTQLATTAYVMAALGAAAVVSSFNGRAGTVTLTSADITNANPPYLPLAGGTVTGNVTFSSYAFFGANSASLHGDANNLQLALPSGNGEFFFQTNNNVSNLATIDGTGNLALFGTSLSVMTTGGQLILHDNCGIYSDATVSGLGESGSITSTSSYRYLFSKTTGNRNWYNYNNTALMMLDSVGNLSIVGTLTQGSDISLKRRIEPASEGLDILRKLVPKHYLRAWPDPPADHPGWKAKDRRELGFIAQEVQEVLPDAVVSQDGMLGVAMMPLIAVLTNAVKTLAARLDTIEANVGRSA
jgi:hypothetical protein